MNVLMRRVNVLMEVGLVEEVGFVNMLMKRWVW